MLDNKTWIDIIVGKKWLILNRIISVIRGDLKPFNYVQATRLTYSFPIYIYIYMTSYIFQAVVVSILLYGCTTWMLTKRMEKKLDGNYTGMLRAILNKSRRQHPTKQQLYGHRPLITKTIKIRRTRHAGHCWRSRDVFISDVPLWTPPHRRAKAGHPARTYMQQLCADTGCSLEDLPEAMDNNEIWRERVRNIRADCVTWWWLHKRKSFRVLISNNW